jgi:hypothetical protein
MCPVCAARESSTGGATTATGAAASRGAALLLRVWDDDGEPRARLIGVDPPYRTVATAHGVDAICDAVRAWIARH